MNIGFDVTPLCVPQSGVGTYTLNLWEHLHRSYPADSVIPFAHRPLLMRREGLPPPVLPAAQHNKTLWMQFQLPFHLRAHHIELAHFTNSVAPLFSPCPTVVTLHDMTLWLYPQHHYTRRLLAMRPIIPLGVRRAAAVIAVSHSAKADIVRLLRVPPEKVQVIYEAPDLAFRPLPPDTVQRLLARYSLPERFILYVGTLEPRKNLERLVEAFAVLVVEGYPHHLVLAGQRGWKESTLFAAIERLGLQSRVHVLSHLSLEALVALYNRAECLAFPSLYEGFGLPVVEAMACGTPVLLSRRGSLGEIAADAAHYVEPTDVDSIHAGLRRLITDSDYRRHLSATGLAHVMRFSWEQTAAATQHLYEQVAASAQPAGVHRRAPSRNEHRAP